MAELYRGWHIEPTQNPYQDGWDYWHDSYDGAPDSRDNRCGFALTEQEAREEIDMYEDEQIGATTNASLG